jgi:hypothetical protein
MSEDKYGLTTGDQELLDEYTGLTGLAKDQFLERNGLVLLESELEKDGQVRWDLDISHGMRSIIIQMQEEGETEDQTFQRVLNGALKWLTELPEDEAKKLVEEFNAKTKN